MAALFVAGAGAQHSRPRRPGGLGRGDGRRLRENLELVDLAGALAVGRAHAITPGVAAPDDGHHLAPGRDRLAAVGGLLARDGAVLGGQVVHGEVNALQPAPGRGQVARHAGTHRKADRVGDPLKVSGRQVLSDEHARLELDALGLHLFDPPVEDGLVQLEIGDSVDHGAPGAVAVGNAAVHAAGGLAVQLVLRQGQLELAAVPKALLDAPVPRIDPPVFDESPRLSHGTPPPSPG